MKRGGVRFPSCDKCGRILNPFLYDDCEKYYVIDGEAYCRDCLKEWLIDLVNDDPDGTAMVLDIPSVYVGGRTYE